MIEGGYYLKARKTKQSKIRHAPPHVREIWDFILESAFWRDGEDLKRGQCLLSYKDIIEGLEWYVGWRKERYSKWQCEIAMKWLTKHEMVAIKKTTTGMVITVINYATYQDPNNYECHNESHKKATRKPQTTDTIEKKYIISNKNTPPISPPKKTRKPKVFVPPTMSDVLDYFQKSGYSVEAGRKFFRYYDAGKWVDGQGKPVRSWKQKAQGVWFKPENEDQSVSRYKDLN